MFRAVQFGAGNIGRGFLAQLYSDSGWETVFVELRGELVRELNRRGRYEIEIVGPGARRVEVKTVRAVRAADADSVAKEVSRADLLATAVGAKALGGVAPLLARGLELRAGSGVPLDVLVCENLLGAPERLRRLVEETIDARAEKFLDEKVGFVGAVIARMIPPPTNDDPDILSVRVERYSALPVDARAFRGRLPQIDGVEMCANFRAMEERKLFVHNAGHAMLAYLGFCAGKGFIWEAVRDPRLRANAEGGMKEAGEALCRRHGFGRGEMAEHIRDLIERFSNRALLDTVRRVGRDPVRKLARRDRLVGASLTCIDEGVEPRMLLEGIAAAMRFHFDDDPTSARLRRLVEERGAGAALEEVCGLAPPPGPAPAPDPSPQNKRSVPAGSPGGG